jgi:integrase/recombinase XerD
MQRTDADIIALWLHGRAERTIESYRLDIEQFLNFASCPLADITLETLQGFSTHLQQRNLKNSSRTRKLNVVKSLFAFATEQRHISMNIAAAIKPPKTSTNLAGRILSKEDVATLIASASSERDRLFLLLTYAIATRASETCSLKWENFTVRSDGKVQVSICGKGGKVASVMVPGSVWRQLQMLRREGSRLFPFTRREGHNIIKRAVKNAGLNPKISLHWLRHAHARHAIEAGAPIHVVRDSLRHSSIATTNWYLESFPDESSSNYLGL